MAAVIPKITKLSSLITRVLGCNPGPMTLQGTNTYLIGTGKRRVLVDAGQSDVPEYINNLSSVLDSEGCELSDIIVTHWHADHIGGVQDILRNLSYVPKVHKYPRLDKPEQDIGKIDVIPLVDGQKIDVEGASVEILHTPGHTTDHVVLHVKEENVLLSADCILGEGTAVFEDLHSYMMSLDKILQIAPAVIYPGHGPIVQDPVSKIEYYIKHRLQRESQIVEVLTGSSDIPLTSMELVKIVYKETPVHLHPVAKVNLEHHLNKLVKDGKVEQIENKWKII